MIYEIDFDKVETFEDLKAIVQALGPVFDTSKGDYTSLQKYFKTENTGIKSKYKC